MLFSYIKDCKTYQTHIVGFFIEVCSVFACVDLREDLRHQMIVWAWGFAITVSMVHS